MSREMIFNVEGRIITIERFEDESDPMFAERSSFILAFRNDVERLPRATKYSFHHIQKMFRGVTYHQEIEIAIRELREIYLSLKAEDKERL